MQEGMPVVVYVVEPKERFWGILKRLDATGVCIHGIDILSFEDWCRQTARPDGERAIRLTGMFFPTRRIEKIIEDESSGPELSMSALFERIVGAPLRERMPL
jgi:hypothetical protein